MNARITLTASGIIMSMLATGCQNVDGEKLAVGAASLGAVGAAGYYAGKHHKKNNKEKSDGDSNQDVWGQQHHHHDSRHLHVQQDQMAKYCIGEVSSKYHVSPRYITTLPLEHDGDHYAVYGQSNDNRGEMDTFMCTFSESGEFRSLRATS